MEVEDQHPPPTTNQEESGNNGIATEIITHREISNNHAASTNDQDNESSSIETANSENGLRTGNKSRPPAQQTDVRIVLRAGPRISILFNSRQGPEYRKELAGMAEAEFYNHMLAWFEVMMRLCNGCRIYFLKSFS